MGFNQNVNLEKLNGIKSLYSGVPIFIVSDVKVQNKKHKKKRINKKWAKRYGFTIYNYMENGEIVNVSGTLYMNERTYNQMQIMGVAY